MDRMIARLNIEHLKRRLSDEKDEAKREILLQLLKEEESKLNVSERGAPRTPKSQGPQA